MTRRAALSGIYESDFAVVLTCGRRVIVVTEITASPCASVSMPNRIPTPTATKPWSSAARTERAAHWASERDVVLSEERQKDRERWFASDAGVRTFSQNTFPRL